MHRVPVLAHRVRLVFPHVFMFFLLIARVNRMKALVFTLVRAFEFELAVPPADVRKTPMVVQRPILRSAPEQGSQMPLLVKRHRRM